MKKFMMLFMAFSVVFLGLTTKSFAQQDVHGVYGVAIDARTGEILYDKNAKDKAYPASVTKMVTAILLDEKVKDGEMMKVSEFAAGQEASNLHYKLEAGEKISKEDAMLALLLISSNDVAVTIAEHIAGSQEEFAKMMTDRVKELGLKDTNFVTASGLHDTNHYSTPYDMAMVAKHILEEHPKVLKVMGTPKAIVNTTKKKDVEIKNPSKIHDNPIALGGKTGYTNAAQNTLVEILEKDGKQVVAVIMKTTLAEEYKDIEIMGNAAFEKMKNYEKKYSENQIVKTKEINGVEVGLKVNRDVYIQVDKKEDLSKLKEKIKIKEKLNDIEVDQEIGKIELYLGDKKIAEEKLYSTKKVSKEDENPKKNITKEEEQGFNFGKFILSIFIPIIIYLLYVYIENRRASKIKKK